VTLDQPDQDVGSQWQWLAGSGGPTCPFKGDSMYTSGEIHGQPTRLTPCACRGLVWGLNTSRFAPGGPPPAWGAADRVPTREPQINPSAWPSPLLRLVTARPTSGRCSLHGTSACCWRHRVPPRYRKLGADWRDIEVPSSPVGSAVATRLTVEAFRRGAIEASASVSNSSTYHQWLRQRAERVASGPTPAPCSRTVRANPSARARTRASRRTTSAPQRCSDSRRAPAALPTRHARAWSRPCSRAQGEPLPAQDCPGQSRSELGVAATPYDRESRG